MSKKMEKVAMEPGTAAALAIGANNLLLAHGHKIPGLKRVLKHTGDAAYHAGFATASKGEKGVGPVSRNLWKLKDLYHPTVYEKGKEHGKKYKYLQEEVRKKMHPDTRSVDINLDHIKKHFGHHLNHIVDEDDQTTIENAVGPAKSRLQHHLNRAARIATADLTPERVNRIKHYARHGAMVDAKNIAGSTRSAVNRIGGNIAGRVGGDKLRHIATSNIGDLLKRKKK